MANRQIQFQHIHDRVIDTAVQQLSQIDHDIYKNPNSQKNAWIGDNYPDIIMVKKGTKHVEFIIEVETSDTINFQEASNQWKKYATEIQASFYLLVPKSHREVTLRLCKQVGITARIGTYEIDFFGNVVNIVYE